MSTWVKIIFTISVLLNVMFIGLAAGSVFQKWQTHPWHETKKSLSPAAQDLVKESFKSVRTDMRSLALQGKEKREALSEVLRAQAFDEESFDRAAEDLMAVQAQMSVKKIETVKGLSQNLSYEDRQKMADKMVRSLNSDRRGHHKNRDQRRQKKNESRPQQEEQAQ